MTTQNMPFSVPEIETDRTIMRSPALKDFEASAAMWANENVVRHITGKPFTRSESWTRLLRYIGHWQVMEFGYWVVEDKATGGFLGEVGFAENRRDISPSLEGIPEVGWVLAPEAQGRGLATEAVMAALEWADANLGCDKTTCIFDPTYRASIRVAEKTGYVEKTLTTYLGAPALIMARPKPI